MIERLENDLKDLKPKHGYVEIRHDLAVRLPELLRSLAENAVLIEEHWEMRRTLRFRLSEFG